MTLRNAHLILIVLVVCTLIAGALLWWVPAPKQPVPVTKDQIDQQIRETLKVFDIPEVLTRTTSLRVDSTFTRTVWIIDLPPSVSKTTLHYSLDQSFRPYGFQTPATIEFPERNMRVHLLWEETVVQTLYLRTADAEDMAKVSSSNAISSSP